MYEFKELLVCFFFNIYETAQSTIILVLKNTVFLTKILLELIRTSELVSFLRALIGVWKTVEDGINQRLGQGPGFQKRSMQGMTCIWSQ